MAPAEKVDYNLVPNLRAVNRTFLTSDTAACIGFGTLDRFPRIKIVWWKRSERAALQPRVMGSLSAESGRHKGY